MGKISALALFALIAFSAASCPNQCSGHGRCEINDKCVCYEQTNTPWGQRNGWVGADCSLRSCPLGIAFDQISNHDDRVGHVRFAEATDGVTSGNTFKVFLDTNYLLARDDTVIVRISEAGVSFQWKWADDVFFQQPVALPETPFIAYELLDHTDSNAPTGIRIHWNEAAGAAATLLNDQWTFDVHHNNEVRWVTNNDNTIHQFTQCSGRGSCNSATGRCECFVGYTGEACQRTSCPSDCSGHGVCQEQRRFAADAGKVYEDDLLNLGPYDANKQMGCLCDLGFRGPDCSMIECPSGADPLGADGGAEGRDCSGRGICDYGSGQCACFKGYFGERCESQNNFV